MKIDTKSFDFGLAKFEAKLPNMLESAMAKGCMVALRDAKKKAPADTGMLRNSIQYKTDINRKEVAGYVYSNLHYAPYVEIGTGRQSSLGNGADFEGMAPRPYLMPAIEENREAILKCFEGLF